MKFNSYHLPSNTPGHHRTWCPGYLKAFAGLAAVILILTILALLPVHALQIEAVREDAVVFLQRIASGDRFSTSYIHSVELSPVGEYFQIDDDFRMVLKETTFESSNVGLPYAAFGNEVFHTEADGFRISNMHRVVPHLLIWADRNYENRLRFKGSDLALYDFRGDTLIQVGVKTLRLGRFILTKAAIWLNVSKKKGQKDSNPA